MGFSMPSLPKLDLPSPSDGPQGSMCQDMEVKLDAAIASLEKAKKAIEHPLQGVFDKIDALTGSIPTPENDINNALGDLGGKLNDAIPKPPSGVDEVKDMLSKCGILNEELPSISSTKLNVKFEGISIKGYADALDSALDDLQSLAEFPIAKALDAIKGILEGFGLGSIISGLDGFLDCLDSMCGSDISGKMDYVNQLMDDMKVNDDGTLDMETIYTESGASSGTISNLANIGNKLTESSGDATAGIADAAAGLVDSVKSIKQESVLSSLGDLASKVISIAGV